MQEEHVILVDAGDVFGGSGEEARRKAETAIQAMQLMGYDGLNLGESEFRFGRPFLDEQRQKAGFAFLSANLVDRHSGEHPYEAYVIKRAGHLKVGIIGLVSPTLYQGLELMAQDPASTLRDILPQVKEEAHFTILLAHMSRAEAVELASEVEGINVIVVAREGKLANRPTEPGDTLIVQSGARGMYVGRLQITADTSGRIIGYGGEVGVLDEQVGDDPQVLQLMAKPQGASVQQGRYLSTGVHYL